MKKKIGTGFLTGAAAIGIIIAASSCKGPKYPEGLYAELQTSKGLIVLALEFEKTPMTVANFVGLAEGTIPNPVLPPKAMFFNGSKFHRVVPEHVIQAGKPAGTDKEGPGYVIPNEIVPGLSHNAAGVLGMANSGPHTNSSQFYITLGDRSYLDGAYTIFGRLVEGMGVVKNIKQGDTIERVKIVRVGKKAKKFRVTAESFQALVDSVKRRIAREEEDKKQKEAEIIKQNWPDAADAGEGIKFRILKPGRGPKSGSTSKLTVVYHGQFLDGRVFSSTADQGKPKDGEEAEPFIFEMGISKLIPGFDVQLAEMKRGETRLVILSPDQAYANRGFYGKDEPGKKRVVVLPGTTLAYTIELQAIK